MVKGRRTHRGSIKKVKEIQGKERYKRERNIERAAKVRENERQNI